MKRILLSAAIVLAFTLALYVAYSIIYASQTAVCTNLKSFVYGHAYIVELDEPYMRVYRKGTPRQFKDFFRRGSLAHFFHSDVGNSATNDLWTFVETPEVTALQHLPSGEQYHCSHTITLFNKR